MKQKTVIFDTSEQISRVFGAFDENTRAVEKEFGVTINNRISDNEETVTVSGGTDEAVEMAAKVISFLKRMAEYEETISEQSVRYLIDTVRNGREDELSDFGDDCLCVTTKGRPIKAKTVGQKQYVEKIKKNTITLGVGPAGTGKTFLAVAMAVKALRDKQVSRIILTRPAIEAGEKLGYLPGDLQSKIDPYLRPLYDALYEMIGVDNFARLREKQTIEIAPLAYMRGRTLDDSFIILDEAQNSTPEQMKMFLTRLGFNSKAVVTGDLTQTDLPHGQRSGLAQAVKILNGIDDIAVHTFTERDVVRHRLVQKIILAYEKYEKDISRSAPTVARYIKLKGSGKH
jgi:phosphate starvation-inducible PhoH-like protein